MPLWQWNPYKILCTTRPIYLHFSSNALHMKIILIFPKLLGHWPRSQVILILPNSLVSKGQKSKIAGKTSNGSLTVWNVWGYVIPTKWQNSSGLKESMQMGFIFPFDNSFLSWDLAYLSFLQISAQNLTLCVQKCQNGVKEETQVPSILSITTHYM